MVKVKPVLIDKVWGYELTVNSPVKSSQTSTADGKLTTDGPIVKIIQADDRLSVQVHPDAEMAKKLENSPIGKSESWYVISAKKGSTIVCGLKDYDKRRIRAMLADGSFEKNLRTIPAKAEDFLFIRAGTVHAIGAGIRIFEVSEPFDKTYRYFDYNRTENGKHRELHVEQALACQKDLSPDLKPVAKDPLTYDLGFCRQSFHRSPTQLKSDGLVVDLLTGEAYKAQKGETVSPSAHFAVVTW